MARLKQVFKNSSDRPLIIFLELSTARYRIPPGEELILFYDSDDEGNGPNMPLSIEYAVEGQYPHITVWTRQDTMYLPDGTEARTNYSY